MRQIKAATWSGRKVRVGFALLVVSLAALGVRSAGAAEVNCGDTITTSTVLTNDVGPCKEGGVVIGADNVVLDLKGHKILGTSAKGDGAGVLITGPRTDARPEGGRTGVVVRNGTVSGFDTGVLIHRGFNNTVEGVRVQDNVGTHCSPPHQTLPEPRALHAGIGLLNTSGNQVFNNKVVDNGVFGVTIRGRDSDGNVIRSNLVQGTVGAGCSDRGFGVHLAGVPSEADEPVGSRSRNHVVEDNTIQGNEHHGILLIVTRDARVRRNQVKNNGWGIGLFLGHGPEDDPETPEHEQFEVCCVTASLLEGNRVLNNRGYGIDVSTARNQIINNVATGNPWYDLTDSSNGWVDCGESSVWSGKNNTNEWRGNTWGPWPGTRSPRGGRPASRPVNVGSYDPECVGVAGHGPTPGIASLYS